MRAAALLIPLAGCVPASTGTFGLSLGPLEMSADAPMYAGIDLREELAVADAGARTVDDSFGYDPEAAVAFRRLEWRTAGSRLIAMCAVAQQDPGAAIAALPQMLAEAGVTEVPARTDRLGAICFELRGRLIAWARGNICVVLHQPEGGGFPLEAMARDLDDRIRRRPPMAGAPRPDLRGARMVGPRGGVGVPIVVELDLHGETGFIPAGWRVRVEKGRTLTFWIHAENPKFSVIAPAPGTYPLDVWVISRTQLVRTVSTELRAQD